MGGKEGEGSGIKSVPITARQLEALVRLTEASAKTRLSKTATREDAKKGIELLHFTLSQIGLDPDTGKLDIDRITTGVTASQRNHIGIVKETISALEKELGQVIPEEEVVKECEQKGMEETKVEEILQKLHRFAHQLAGHPRLMGFRRDLQVEYLPCFPRFRRRLWF